MDRQGGGGVAGGRAGRTAMPHAAAYSRSMLHCCAGQQLTAQHILAVAYLAALVKFKAGDLITGDKSAASAAAAAAHSSHQDKDPSQVIPQLVALLNGLGCNVEVFSFRTWPYALSQLSDLGCVP